MNDEVRHQQEEEAFIRTDVKKFVLPKHLDVDEEDAVTLLVLLVATGIISFSRLSEKQPNSATVARSRRFDLKEQAYFDCSGPTRRKGSGRKRITCVRLGRWDTPAWTLHTERTLDLLSKLEDLETLYVDRCESFRLTEILARFPNLKCLDASCYHLYGTTISPIDDSSFDFLSKIQSSNLEILNLSGYTVEGGSDLAILLFDIFPFLPKLTTFRTKYNTVESFQGIAKRIHDCNDNEVRKANNSRLRLLDLGELYKKRSMRAKLANDPMEIEAIKTVLFAFRELNNICGFLGLESSRQFYEYLDKDIAYQMELNFVGRALVESTNKEDDSGTSLAIPSSVWPNILAKTWKQNPRLIMYRSVQPVVPSTVSPDGIYYLLQNVWAIYEGRK